MQPKPSEQQDQASVKKSSAPIDPEQLLREAEEQAEEAGADQVNIIVLRCTINGQSYQSKRTFLCKVSICPSAYSSCMTPVIAGAFGCKRPQTPHIVL